MKKILAPSGELVYAPHMSDALREAIVSLGLEDIHRRVIGLFYEKRIQLYTGSGGKDDHDIQLEQMGGMYRKYLGKKISRIVRRGYFPKPIHRDYRDRLYILYSRAMIKYNSGLVKL